MRLTLILLSLALCACDGAVQVSASGFGAFEPALAVADGKLAVAWYDNRHGSDEIYLRLLDDALRPLTPEWRLTESAEAAYEPAVVVYGDVIAVSWYAKNAAGELTVMLGLWDQKGRPLWRVQLSNPAYDGRVPVMARVGARVFIAWIEEPRGTANMDADATIYGAWLDAGGPAALASFQIAAASPTTWNLNTSPLPDGRVALVFDADRNTSSSELYVVVVDAGPAAPVQLTRDDGFASKYPDIAISVEATALTWFDEREGNNEIYLGFLDPHIFLDPQTLEADSAITLLEQNTRRLTTTPGDSIGAYLAWNGAILGLAWNDDDTGQHEIYFQTFDPRGNPLRAPLRLTHTEADSQIPAIEPHSKGFVLVWGEVVLDGDHAAGQSGTRSEVVARYLE